MKSPDHRALALAAGEPAQGLVEEEFLLLRKGQPVSAALQYAADIYEDSYKSEVLEAFLLARATDADVERVIRVPAGVVRIYRQLFFDMAAFRDELDVEAYAQTYPETDSSLKYGREMKISAITLGLDYLAYRFGRGANAQLDINAAVTSMVETAYVLAKNAKLNPMDSDAAREARQWMVTSLKAAETYAKVKPTFDTGSNDDFKVALANIDKTTNEEKSKIKVEDIVH